MDCDQIQRDFKNLKQQHQVVSKKVLQLILEHQNGCNEEFLKILEICQKLQETLNLCRAGRKNLNVAEKQFSTSLSILANYRKRRLAQNLLNNLNTIKTLVFLLEKFVLSVFLFGFFFSTISIKDCRNC